MEDFNATGNYYTIGHIVQFTGLSDRTIRNYISMGILQGEKINSVWHFNAEQIDAFISHPSVRPSILAKNNAIVYDFLLDDKKKNHEICVILDFPNGDRRIISEFFCYSINNGNYQNVRFSFDAPFKRYPRVILKGNTNDVLQLVNKYYSEND